MPPPPGPRNSSPRNTDSSPSTPSSSRSRPPRPVRVCASSAPAGANGARDGDELPGAGTCLGGSSTRPPPGGSSGITEASSVCQACSSSSPPPDSGSSAAAGSSASGSRAPSHEPGRSTEDCAGASGRPGGRRDRSPPMGGPRSARAPSSISGCPEVPPFCPAITSSNQAKAPTSPPVISLRSLDTSRTVRIVRSSPATPSWIRPWALASCSRAWKFCSSIWRIRSLWSMISR